MSITASERKNADYHAGPHGSFPVDDDGEHFEAAWHLAETGHGSDPAAILAHLRAFAEKHGIPIPKSKVKKATGGELRDLYHMAYHHEQMEGDKYQQHELIRFAAANGHQQFLPPEAHSHMHEISIPHNHDGVQNNDMGMHEHRVVKAFSVTGEIVKSWDVGDDAIWEGWLSTPHMDREKDVTLPTAFVKPMDAYFSLRAPVSLEHDGKNIPIGHLQKAAVLVDGKVVKSAEHPTDPHDFEFLPLAGSGVWVRGIANEPLGIRAIRKGNVGGMSFIATATAEALPGGRYTYTNLDPWVESTIAAYPINPQAVIAVTKAYGLPQEGTTNMTLSVEQIMAEAAAKIAADKAQADAASTTVETVTKADFGAALVQFKDLMLGEVKSTIEAQIEEIKKAASVPPRGEGTGRQGTATVTPEAEREADPFKYVLKKAQEAKGEDDKLDDVDKLLIGEITYNWLTQGLPALNGSDEE